jgi:hypothetical protein
MTRVPAGVIAGALLLTMCTAEKPQPVPPSAVPPAAPAPGAGSPAEWAVTPRGVGPVRFGMSVAEARVALGDSLANVPADGSCAMVTPAGVPAGVAFMIEGGQVVRVDVTAESVATDRGAKVGHSEVVVQERYGDSLVSGPHKYDPKGKYLTFVPPAADDARFRLIFETDGIRVRSYRAGIQPAVEYVERCG